MEIAYEIYLAGFLSVNAGEFIQFEGNWILSGEGDAGFAKIVSL